MIEACMQLTRRTPFSAALQASCPSPRGLWQVRPHITLHALQHDGRASEAVHAVSCWCSKACEMLLGKTLQHSARLPPTELSAIIMVCLCQV
jgi:hypothetical protein